MKIILIVILLMFTGCTCAKYYEKDIVGTDSTEKVIYYCSTKDVSGLHVRHGDTTIDLDKSDNQAGDVILGIAEKIRPPTLFSN